MPLKFLFYFFILIFFGIILLLFKQDNTVEPLNPVEETNHLIVNINSVAIAPLPLQLSLDEKKVELGNKLFHEVKLSKNNSISCASCHNLDKAGVDGLVFSTGIDGLQGNANAPTVFNSGFNFVQFWDGRANTLEEQAAGPIHNPIEMGSNWGQVLTKLKKDKNYPQLFQAIYGNGSLDANITEENIVDAIATFERSLITPNSPFDRYLNGEKNALSNSALRGYKHFKDYGCVSCHQGINIGGNMFQRFGISDDFFDKKPKLSKTDLGRFNVTGLESDRHVFKVPSLRNIALTAPYFHDGSAKTLEEAISIMSKYQLGRELSARDTQEMKSFLESLTGQWQGKTLQ